MSEEMISKERALKDVLSFVKRAALLHNSFSQVLIEELGEEKGKELIHKAIRSYGEYVGNKVKEETLAKGLDAVLENYQEDLPSLGWQAERVVVDGEPRARVHHCPLAEVWKELGVPEIGRIYCYVDQAKYAAFNENYECVHVTNTLDGDAYCDIAVREKKG